MLIRSWNLFHGNTTPPSRREYLKEMVRVVTADGPDVVCLQELSVWALSRLEAWSGMRALMDVARRPRLPPPLDRLVTELDSGLFRSLFTGQAQAILLRPELEVVKRTVYVLNRRSGLGTGDGERRICQIVRLQRPGKGTVVVANLHATNSERLASEQVERTAAHALELAHDDEPVVLAGDFNLTPDLGRYGFTEGGPMIDHILVRGDDPGPVLVWPDERRTVDGKLLSDHAPVERTLQ